MATTSADYVALRQPSLVGDSRLTAMIALAEEELSATTYGTRYAYAVALLTLHYYATENRGGVGGAVTSATEGRLSRSYDVSAGSSRTDDWSTTKWGIELQHVTDGLVFQPRNRMMS